MEVNVRRVGEYVEITFKIDNTEIVTGLLSKEEAEEYLTPMREAIDDCGRYFD